MGPAECRRDAGATRQGGSWRFFRSSGGIIDVVQIPQEQLDQVIDLVRDPGEEGYGTPLGFAFYYAFTTGRQMPPHAIEKWIPGVYEAIKLGYRDIGIEAFRGAIKSSVFSNFISYQMGLAAHLENLIVQIQDKSADDSTKYITNLIEHSAAFHAFFPGIVPDKEQGWGADGYCVKDEAIDKDTWLNNMRSRDPSLLGAGYKSGILIGKHPRRFLWIDDIHNSRNTRSQRELMAVKEIYSKDIRNMRTANTIALWSFTPWVHEDLYYNIKKSKKFFHILTPITKNGKWPGESVWPSEYPEERVQEIHDDPSVGPIAFAQMYLCDIEAKKGAVLPGEWISNYPAHEIQPSWKTVMGIDYASVQSKQDIRGRDYFSLAVGKIHPVSGMIVLVDGIQDHLTQAEAEQSTLDFLTKYKRTLFRCGIEALGKGEEFYNLILRRHGRGIRPQKVGGKGKGERFEKQLAPAFFDGRIAIASDDGVDTYLPINYDYIEIFVTQWLMWDGTETYPDDTLDAVYHMALASKGFMMVGAEKQEFPHDTEKKTKNPILAFGVR